MKKTLKMFMVVAALVFAGPKIFAQVSLRVSVRIAPPPLPVYVQPECPVDGYLWEPGYWAYDDIDGYYWVPGVWVAPPDPGLYWTPCYWGFDNGYYRYHAGYWGPHVGFYGGINYGYGYPGEGFYGGTWSGRAFRYNTAVFNVNRAVVRNVYVDRTVVRNVSANHVSFNGPGGVSRRPNATEQRFTAERHIQPTRTQLSHQQVAAKNPAQHFAANHGRPATPAINRVNDHPVNQPARTPNRGTERPNPAAIHNAEARPSNRGTLPNRNTNQPQRMQQPRPGQEQRQQRQQRAEQPQLQQQQPRMEQPRPQQQARPQQQPRVEQPRPQPQGGEMHPPGGGEHSGGRPPQAEPQQPRPQPQQQQPRPQPQQGPPGGNQHPPGGGEHSGGGRRPPQ